jgi:hypothetical protein
MDMVAGYGNHISSDKHLNKWKNNDILLYCNAGCEINFRDKKTKNGVSQIKDVIVRSK